MKDIKIDRIHAYGLGIFEFDFLITDLKSDFIFWINPGLNFAIYKSLSKYLENEYVLIGDGDNLEELIINLENIEKIREFIILKDGNIHLHCRSLSHNLIVIDSEHYNGTLNLSMTINRSYLPRFIEILNRFKRLPFHEKIDF